MDCRAVAAAAMTLTLGVASQADVLDFDSFVHGAVVSDQYLDSNGVLITAVNHNRPFDIAAAFDTTLSGTADEDLEAPWSGGNLPSGTILGRVLILAENNRDKNGDGLLDSPDDEGRRSAGRLVFDFSTAIASFGFDIIDVEGLVEETSEVRFYSGGTLLDVVGFETFTDDRSSTYRSTVSFGDNTANSITPITASELGRESFDRVVVELGGSGAIDNIRFNPVPSPGGLALCAVGLAFVRRRRSRLLF